MVEGHDGRGVGIDLRVPRKFVPHAGERKAHLQAAVSGTQRSYAQHQRPMVVVVSNSAPVVEGLPAGYTKCGDTSTTSER